jgi:hypothetical protein
MPDPLVRQRLADLGQNIPSRDRLAPEPLDILQKCDIEKWWWPIIKAAGVKGE